MARLRKKSIAKKLSVSAPITAQPKLPILEPEVVSRVRNFSYPFTYKSNQECYREDVGEQQQWSPTEYGKGSGTDRTEISLNGGPMISNSRGMHHHAYDDRDRKSNHPIRKETLGFFQHGEFAYRKNDFKPQEPVAPILQNIEDEVTRQPSASTAPLSIPTQRFCSLPMPGSARIRMREEVPSPAISLPGLCKSPDCPIQKVHYEGVYLDRNCPMLSESPFGASNPPPCVWTAYYRMQEKKDSPKDLSLFWGFKRNHTASSWESLLRGSLDTEI